MQLFNRTASSKKDDAATQAAIQEIHDTFNSAGEKLLNEALAIINDNESVIKKGERLKKVGFANTIEAKKWDQVSVTAQLAALINHYQIVYPNNKFITEDQVGMICKKYNLVCAPINKYKGFVPEGKLQQIEKFTLKKEDESDPILHNVDYWSLTETAMIEKEIKDEYPLGIPLSAIQDFGAKSIKKKNRLNFSNNVWVRSFEVPDITMLICAPEKDMDLSGLKKIANIFWSTKKVTIPDPVVLQPVKGGYLIIAAWGDEASDELVVNEKHN